VRDHRREKVAVGTPYGSYEPHFVQSWTHLLAWDANHYGRIVGGGASIALGTTNVAHGRNQITRTFWEDTDADWLWWIDTDMQFAPDTLDRMIEAADPTDRPILGALCFSFNQGESQEIIPTLYGLVDGPEGQPVPARAFSLPEPDGVHHVWATGTGCLLVHRRVVDAVFHHRPDPEGQAWGETSWPWFKFSDWTVENLPDVMGEDLTFCARANAAGFPVHVDTRIEVGHVKPVVIDRRSYEAAQGIDRANTYVVVPMKDRRDLTERLLRDLHGQGGYDRIFVYDNGSNKTTRNWLSTLNPDWRVSVVDADGWNLHRMWNDGIARAVAAGGGKANVAVLNNDLHIGPNFLPGLAEALRSNPRLWAVCANYDGREADQPLVLTDQICAGRYDGTGGFAGFAFMLRGEAIGHTIPPFSEDLDWFFGDNELLLHIKQAGGVAAIVTGTTVEHVDGGGQTTTKGGNATHGADWLDTLSPRMRNAYEHDEAVFRKHWSADPLEDAA